VDFRTCFVIVFGTGSIQKQDMAASRGMASSAGSRGTVEGRPGETAKSLLRFFHERGMVSGDRLPQPSSTPWFRRS